MVSDVLILVAHFLLPFVFRNTSDARLSDSHQSNDGACAEKWLLNLIRMRPDHGHLIFVFFFVRGCD